MTKLMTVTKDYCLSDGILDMPHLYMQLGTLCKIHVMMTLYHIKMTKLRVKYGRLYVK